MIIVIDYDAGNTANFLRALDKLVSRQNYQRIRKRLWQLQV